MKRWRQTVILAAFVMLVIPGCKASPTVQNRPVLLIVERQDGKTLTLTVELALTPAAQERGLMFRKSLSEKSGMLFVFDGETEHAFWMRNTLIPLDMLFIRQDGTIHSIHANAVPHDETPIASQGPVHSVLEIGGGQAKVLGIQTGDKIRLRNPG